MPPNDCDVVLVILRVMRREEIGGRGLKAKYVDPPPPRPANNKVPQKIRSEQECALDTPFGTQLIRYINPVPD